MSMHYMCAWCLQDQKRALESLELKLQKVVYCHVRGNTVIPAVGTVEVVWMVRVILEDQRLFINDGMAFLADVFSKASGLFTVMAWTTQVSIQGQNGNLKS